MMASHISWNENHSTGESLVVSVNGDKDWSQMKGLSLLLVKVFLFFSFLFLPQLRFWPLFAS
jgi:hypothetical protein